MSSVLDTSRPSSLRLFGFLFTAAGGLLIALGSLQTWATVGIKSDSTGVLDSPIVGVDRADGKATLVIGIVILVAIVALRIAASAGARRAIAIAIVLGAIAATAIGVRCLVQLDARFQDVGIEKVATTLVERGVPPDQALKRASAEPTVDIGPGLWLVTAGGAIALVGGLLDLAWVGQQRLEHPDVDADAGA